MTSLLGRLTEAIRKALLDNSVDSVENAAMHSWRCRYPDRYGACDCFEETVNDVRNAVTALPEIKSALEQRKGWISVKERLPATGPTWSDTVLVHYDSGAMDVKGCIIFNSGEVSWNIAPGVMAKITHWMPLPPAPGVQAEKEDR